MRPRQKTQNVWRCIFQTLARPMFTMCSCFDFAGLRRCGVLSLSDARFHVSRLILLLVLVIARRRSSQPQVFHLTEFFCHPAKHIPALPDPAHTNPPQLMPWTQRTSTTPSRQHSPPRSTPPHFERWRLIHLSIDNHLRKSAKFGKVAVRAESRMDGDRVMAMPLSCHRIQTHVKTWFCVSSCS